MMKRLLVVALLCFQASCSQSTNEQYLSRGSLTQTPLNPEAGSGGTRFAW